MTQHYCLLDEIERGLEILSEAGAKVVFTYVASAYTSSEIAKEFSVIAAAVDAYIYQPKFKKALARARGRASHAAMDRAHDVLEAALYDKEIDVRIAQKMSNLWVIKAKAYAVGYTGIFRPSDDDTEDLDMISAEKSMRQIESGKTILSSISRTRAISEKK